MTTARMLRLGREPQIIAPLRRANRRQAARLVAAGTVALESNSGQQATAELHDFTAYGCNLIGYADWLSIGKFIAIRFDNDETVHAIVRWTRDGSTGVEFLRPLPFEMAEQIASLVD
jgi:hypothetical protein